MTLGLLPIALLVSCAWAQQPTEFEVEAAFLLNFTKFIEWPASVFSNADSPFTICILGKDPFGRLLDDVLAGETAGERHIVVRRLAEAPTPHACQVLFMRGPRNEARSIVSSLSDGILTVGEGDNFIREGGMIAFVIDNRRVRFDVNLAAAERNGLKVSSRLLTVARTVQK